ncbi:MAG: glycoside hydrolase family 43 protein [Myxococcota bacterium]|nr:glycoside hydrolase family 43 protein [Myxococcota bacterium]
MALNIGRARGARVAVFVLSCVATVVAARVARAAGYVFSTFHNDTAAGEKLSTFRSADALQFTLVSDTGFAGPSGYLRDPSIIKHVDGKYYVAYTDPLTPTCCGKVDHFSVASSADLVHWTNVTAVMAGVPGVAHAWAPEWFVDGGAVYLIANIDTLNNDTDFKPYVFTALDSTLTAWSGPTPLGFGPNYIDTFVLKARGVYHAFTKNETTRYLEHATAPSLTGPWTFVGRGNWSGFGPGMEGPCVVPLDDGTWRIYVDSQTRPITARFLTATSPDLTTWSQPIVLPGWGGLRHGTVVRDSPGGTPAPTDGGTSADGGGDAGPLDAAGDDAARDAAGGADEAGDDGSNVVTGADAGAAVDGRSPGPSLDVTQAPDASVLAEGGGIAPAVDAGHGGCSCRAGGRSGPGSGFAACALLALGWRRRRGWRPL